MQYRVDYEFICFDSKKNPIGETPGQHLPEVAMNNRATLRKGLYKFQRAGYSRYQFNSEARAPGLIPFDRVHQVVYRLRLKRYEDDRRSSEARIDSRKTAHSIVGASAS